MILVVADVLIILLRNSGGYSDGAPPLPIPNREVKPVSADGTAYCGRVGRRQLLKRDIFRKKKVPFFVVKKQGRI